MRDYWVSICLVLVSSLAAQEEPALKAILSARRLLGEAQTAIQRGESSKALELANRAVIACPSLPEGWMMRGRLRAGAGLQPSAAGDFAKVIELQPRNHEAYLERALARLRQGRVPRAIEDYDRAIVLVPALAPQVWPRGLALGLEGRWADARRQFESHRALSTNDVELAAWHFLSVAKIDGLTQARAALLPVTDDPRVPMPEVHAMLTGRSGPDEVRTAANAAPAGTNTVGSLAHFYAGLYIALYHDAAGEPGDAVQALQPVAAGAERFGLIGDVARLYLDRLRALEPAREEEPPGQPAAESVH
ncbi:MAG: tetratricopeptide repeat protein [Limisphaerales bacterium]